MADQQITDLPVATAADDADLLLIRQSLTDKQITKEILFENALAADQNLSDVPNKATARTNLDVPQIAAVCLKANNLSDVASVSSARTNLDVPQISAVCLRSNNLSDVANAATARDNLGVEIGSDVQGYSAELAALAANNSTAGLIAQTGLNTVASRTLTAPAAGMTISNPTGAGGNPTFALANDLSAIEALASTGFAVRTTTDTWAQRTLTAPAAGLTISNPAGIAGDPTFALANDLSALEALSSTGIAVRTGSDAWAQRTITGTSNQIDVTNGSGASGNPTLALPNAVIIPATSSLPSSLTLLERTTNGTNKFKTIASESMSEDITLIQPPNQSRVDNGGSGLGNYYGMFFPAPASLGDDLQLEIVPARRLIHSKFYTSIGASNLTINLNSATYYSGPKIITFDIECVSASAVTLELGGGTDGDVMNTAIYYTGTSIIAGTVAGLNATNVTSIPITLGTSAKMTTSSPIGRISGTLKFFPSAGGVSTLETSFIRSSDNANCYMKICINSILFANGFNSLKFTSGTGNLKDIGLSCEVVPFYAYTDFIN